MIGAVENGILARLRAAEPALGYHWATLETYPVDWDEYLTSDGKGPINAPAAWVTFAGFGAGIETGNGRSLHEATFGVVVMAENLRNETATRHGDATGKPGSYQLVTDVAGLLLGDDLGLDIGRFRLGSLRFVARLPALAKRKVSMLALELRTEIGIDPAGWAELDELDRFETFHANWDLPPFGNVDGDPGTPGVQIPADATADATDHVTLEQPA